MIAIHLFFIHEYTLDPTLIHNTHCSIFLDRSSMVPGVDDSIISAPEVEPPKTAKENIYENPEVFKDFDNQAIEVCVEHFEIQSILSVNA